jgi:hypothetical protein
MVGWDAQKFVAWFDTVHAFAPLVLTWMDGAS